MTVFKDVVVGVVPPATSDSSSSMSEELCDLSWSSLAISYGGLCKDDEGVLGSWKEVDMEDPI